jgi:hypothetical protein
MWSLGLGCPDGRVFGPSTETCQPRFGKLAPDVAKAFADEAAVNEALRLVIRLGEIPTGHKRQSGSRARSTLASSIDASDLESLLANL